MCFQRGSHGKADGFLGLGNVCDEEVGGQWIESTGNAFHAGVEGFQIDCDIGFLAHPSTPPFF